MFPSGFFSTFASDKETHLKRRGELLIINLLKTRLKYLTSRPHFLTCRLRSDMISEAQMFFSFTSLLTCNVFFSSSPWPCSGGTCFFASNLTRTVLARERRMS